tara:strand:+ start:500 stop:640 length:141 start_codon:yes stop_codon:yes gene_type:complete
VCIKILVEINKTFASKILISFVAPKFSKIKKLKNSIIKAINPSGAE